jgi:MFS family permease
MAEKTSTTHVESHSSQHVPPHHSSNKEEVLELGAPMEHVAEYQEARHIDLTWKSWTVVFVSCFAIMAQVFVVVAAGSVIAFIIRDLGDAAIAGWVIQVSQSFKPQQTVNSMEPTPQCLREVADINPQGPLLMQSVLSPFVGRLSDVLDRKYMAAIPPLIAFVGAVISAKATSMSMLIGGGVLIGVTLSTISIVQAIPSEVLPLKYRALANGFAFIGGAVGGLVGGLGAGGLTNARADGWRGM